MKNLSFLGNYAFTFVIVCSTTIFANAQGKKYSCDSFCVESIKMDTTNANMVDVVIYNDNAAFISYPVVEIIYNGDTVANKKKEFFYYGQSGKSRQTHFLPTTLKLIPANFKCKVVFYGWAANKDTCLLSYPCNLSTSIGGANQDTPMSFRVYPDPTTSTLNLESSETMYLGLNLKIYSITGKEVISQYISRNGKFLSINVESLVKGIYFIRMIEQSSTFTIKFIKD
jgi:hypothetical protein